jgi:hypothetical protein
MIVKNIDFYRQKDLNSFKTIYLPFACSDFPNQLVVSKISGQANLNYGTICDGLYSYIFETGAIKMKQGKDKDSFLSLNEPEKNLVQFSFNKDQILVLTCSLAFVGSTTKEGSQVQPAVLNNFIGITDCFFQEKSKENIIDGYFTDTRGFRKIADDAEEFQGISKEKSSIETLSTENPPTEEKTCPPCPVYSYDIDIPIYGNGIQYRTGPITLGLYGPFLEAGEFAAITASCGDGGGGSSPSNRCPCEETEEDKDIEWVSYIKAVDYIIENDN